MRYPVIEILLGRPKSLRRGSLTRLGQRPVVEFVEHDALAHRSPAALTTYDELNKNAIETATKGIGRLVDADMDVTAVRIRALGAQWQLATQALGIANSKPGRILELFR